MQISRAKTEFYTVKEEFFLRGWDCCLSSVFSTKNWWYFLYFLLEGRHHHRTACLQKMLRVFMVYWNTEYWWSKTLFKCWTFFRQKQFHKRKLWKGNLPVSGHWSIFWCDASNRCDKSFSEWSSVQVEEYSYIIQRDADNCFDGLFNYTNFECSNQ